MMAILMTTLCTDDTPEETGNQLLGRIRYAGELPVVALNIHHVDETRS